MSRRIFTTSLSLFIILFFISSCSKSDVISNDNDVVGTWAVTGISSDMAYDWNGDGYTETDIYGSYSNCQRDIVLVFDQYGTGQGRQGCNAYWQNLNWQVSNSGRTLHIDMINDVIDLDNLSVRSNTIRGEDHVSVNGRNYTITYTLSRR
jgi:hypothetical protein